MLFCQITMLIKDLVAFVLTIGGSVIKKFVRKLNAANSHNKTHIMEWAIQNFITIVI